MNYFERLVRRAVQQPAVRPGSALVNPFEQVAEWPLETPLSRTAAPVPAMPALTRSGQPPPPASPLEASPQTIESSRHDVERAVVPDVRPDVPGPATSRPLTGHNSDPAVSIPPSPVQPSMIAPPDPAPSPLAHADEFLRGLGVRVPAPPPVPIVSPLPPRAAPARPVRPEFAPAPIETAAAPVMPPQVTPPAARPADAAIGERRAADMARAAEPSPRPRPVPHTREVVVVERRRGAIDERPTPRIGVGSPHIGLGQL